MLRDYICFHVSTALQASPYNLCSFAPDPIQSCVKNRFQIKRHTFGRSRWIRCWLGFNMFKCSVSLQMYSSVHFHVSVPFKLAPAVMPRNCFTVLSCSRRQRPSIAAVEFLPECRWKDKKNMFFFCQCLSLALQTRALGKHLLVCCTVEPYHCNLSAAWAPISCLPPEGASSPAKVSKLTSFRLSQLLPVAVLLLRFSW